MAQEHQIDEETERLQRLAVSPDGFDPVLRDQIETSLHAGYAWKAKYAKYGVIWVWFFWVLKWGFAAAAMVALVGAVGQLLTIRGYSDWLQWLTAGAGLSIGFGFFAIMHSGMAAAQTRDEKLAAQYHARSRKLSRR